MKWLVLLILFLPVLGAQSPRDSAREITSRSEYRGYRVESSDSKRSDFDGQSGSSGDSGRTSPSDSGTRRGARGEERVPQRDTGPRYSSGSGGGGWIAKALMYVMWAIFIAGIAVALFFIVKALVNMKWRGRRKKSKPAETSTATTATSETDMPDVPEELMPAFRDALQQAMDEYEKALANKDWSRATLLSYRIFWLKAGWQGCVEEEDVRTWRDAIRMVATREHRQTVKSLLKLVEHVRYGKHSPNELEFRKWLQQLQGLPTRGVLA